MKEITVTFWNGCIESVKNIPRGQTLITRDIDEDSQEPLIIRRWYFDGTNERIYEGEIQDEPPHLIHDQLKKVRSRC